VDLSYVRIEFKCHFCRQETNSYVCEWQQPQLLKTRNTARHAATTGHVRRGGARRLARRSRVRFFADISSVLKLPVVGYMVHVWLV
jgi:hypothetical protein